MRIAIDLISEPKNGTGVSRYAKNLLFALQKIDNKNEYFIYLCKENLEYFEGLWGKFNLISIPFLEKSPIARRLFQQIVLPIMMFFHKINIVHSVNNVLPLLCKKKKVVTVHDIAYAKYPLKRFKGFKKVFYEYFVPRSVKAANRIIVPSGSTSDDICRFFNINKKDVNIINESHDAIFWPSSEIDKEETRKKFNINGDYILFVGNVEPIKNLDLVIEAFDSINKKDISLLIAGNLDWAFDELKSNIEKRKLTSKVVFTGFVSDLELRHLYSGARAFILASLYEGFGLPILEAMVCGTPVISSNSSSLPEVTGDAAVLFDPHSLDELTKAMKNVLENSGAREALISKGLEQVKKFSWEKCAKETLKVYEEVYRS